MKLRSFNVARSRQRGATVLTVSIILLVLVTIAAAFSLSVGVFEQRVVGNELRARAVAQVADAGLNHGIEVIKANAAKLTLSAANGGWGGHWTRCAADSGNFPCAAEPDPARRASLYFYSDQTSANPTNLIGAGSNVVDSPEIAQVGNFEVDYRVGALLCLIDPEIPSNCTSYEDNFNGLVALTLVSRGFLVDEPDALGDVKATIASYRTIGNGPEVPIMAAGAVDLDGGSAEIVPNPNAGGFGVAMSVWSAGDVSMDTGTVQTCHLGEFLANPKQGGAAGRREYDGIQICHGCSCDGLTPEKGLISGKSTDGGVNREKSYDIIDAEGNEAVAPVSFFPDHTKSTCRDGSGALQRCDEVANCFDDTIFEYLFGVNILNVPGDVACAGLDTQTEEEFLEELAEDPPTDCATLGAASTGLHWSTAACNLPGHQVGTPSNPVFLVADCSVRLSNNTVFYGVVFSRGLGTDCELRAQGGGVLYGSAVMDGGVRVRGGPKFIYNEKVIQAILSSPSFNRFGVVPGSWIDIVETGE